MRIIFDALRLDRPALKSRWDVLLGVVADFSIVIGERLLLHEEMFPILELARALKHWSDDCDGGVIRDFSYQSMESAEGPLLEFVQRDNGWSVRSPHLEYSEERVLTFDEVRDAARQFVEDAQRAAATQLGLEVDRWLPA
jgi:hypothetical protein